MRFPSGFFGGEIYLIRSAFFTNFPVTREFLCGHNEILQKYEFYS